MQDRKHQGLEVTDRDDWLTRLLIRVINFLDREDEELTREPEPEAER